MIKLHRHELSLKARWGVEEWIVSSSDARGPGYEPRPLRFKKYHFYTPKP